MWLAGIKKLEMQPPGSEGRRNYETTGVFSPDGEYLPFVAPIVTEGRPEEWLNTVEAAMFAATKRHLYRVPPLPSLLVMMSDICCYALHLSRSNVVQLSASETTGLYMSLLWPWHIWQ